MPVGPTSSPPFAEPRCESCSDSSPRTFTDPEPLTTNQGFRCVPPGGRALAARTPQARLASQPANRGPAPLLNLEHSESPAPQTAPRGHSRGASEESRFTLMGRPSMSAGKHRLAAVALAHVLAITVGGGRIVAEGAAGVAPLTPPEETSRRCCCGTPDGRCCGMGCCRAQVPHSHSAAAVVDLRPVGDWWCTPRTGGLRTGTCSLSRPRWESAHAHDAAAPDTLQRLRVRLNI